MPTVAGRPRGIVAIGRRSPRRPWPAVGQLASSRRHRSAAAVVGRRRHAVASARVGARSMGRPRSGSGTRRRGSGPPAHVGRLERHRVGRVDDLGLHLEVLEDPVEQGERALDLDLDVEQLAEREEQPALERGERDDVADGRRRRVALDREIAGQPVHERRRDAEDRADDHEEPAADHRLADLERGQLRVERPEAVDRASCWPNVLASRIPLTLSVSSVSADISASDFWVSRADLAPDLADPEREVHEERQQPEREQRSAASR